MTCRVWGQPVPDHVVSFLLEDAHTAASICRRLEAGIWALQLSDSAVV